MKILLMGPPASGKGTIGKLLSEELDLPIISVGKLLRDVPESDSNYDEIHRFMDGGELVDYGLVSELLLSEVEKSKYDNGYILDGWMRNLEQVDYFDPEPDFVIFLDISDEVVIKRISGRRFCPNDDFSCNIYTLPPKEDGRCDKCGGELAQREDDSVEVVKTRLELYEKETIPVVEDFMEMGILLEVDGEPSPGIVLSNVLEGLAESYDQD